ncbi:MAG: Sec-independent protein translocase protein TatB [Caldilineaceae bacterium]
MNSFFGIGFMELFFIAVLALIVLGPERLPGAIREVAKHARTLRSLSSELTSQFSEELKALDDINPQKILRELTEDPAEEKKPAKATPAKPSSTNKATTPKPGTNGSGSTAKPATKQITATAAAVPMSGDATEDSSAAGDAAVDEPETTAEPENSILPPAADDATADEATPSTKPPAAAPPADAPPAGQVNGTAATVNASDSAPENSGSGKSNTETSDNENSDTVNSDTVNSDTVNSDTVIRHRERCAQ